MDLNMVETQVAVSVICNAYNHGKYIRDTLEGFVMQETDFKFEVLVHDDASTDNTADIIREYEGKYPEIIKPIYQTENQYSQGIKPGAKFQYPRAKGKYIAFCEGDDYWTDPKKLQKQYDALELHPEIDICAHKTRVIMAKNGKTVRYISPADKDMVLKAEDVIYGEGDFVCTNSLMFRPHVIHNPTKFRQQLMLDYTMQIQGSLNGGMLYLDDCMSVYRYMAENSWTRRVKTNPEKRVELYRKKQKMLDVLNEETEQKYTAVIERRKLKNEFLHKLEQFDFNGVFSKKYKSVYKEFSFLERVKIRIKVCFPFLVTLKWKLF